MRKELSTITSKLKIIDDQVYGQKAPDEDEVIEVEFDDATEAITEVYASSERYEHPDAGKDYIMSYEVKKQA